MLIVEIRSRCLYEKWLGFSRSAIIEDMEVSETIQCPYCGESFDLVVDTSTPAQRFTTDCEVCCRPFEVVAECELGQVLSLEVLGG